jgi:O-antigen ligase
MAKKKRSPAAKPAPVATPAGTGAHGAAAAAPVPPAPEVFTPQPRVELTLPPELGSGDWGGGWIVALLALTMFLAPALGVPHEEMLQDTLKSMVVSFGALGAGIAFFWGQRQRTAPLRWHGLMWLPLSLMAYALGSMAWSHAYLGGVEAIRWFVLSLLLWLGLNTLNRERLPMLAWGIHLGAFVAAIWTALQFWVDFTYFPQGPNPASTFVNRNFFAEFVVCTLPFSTLLLLRARMSAAVAVLALTTGFNLVAIMMTGTRSAQLAFIAMLLVLPVVVWRYRSQWTWSQWSRQTRLMMLGTLLGTVLVLGLIPTGNPKLIAESPSATTPFQRTLARTQSMTETAEYTQRSFSMRVTMWMATARMIAANPLTGVGAGAWEVAIPLYQSEGSQLETDYYAHNEILQLLAEYGLVGALFLVGLLTYLLSAAWETFRSTHPEAQAEGPGRGLTLTSLLMFLIVSNAGFPWRMATTGAMFALSLSVLAASDARLGLRGQLAAQVLPWRAVRSQVAAITLVACTVLAGYISQQAAECESKIVRAVKIALTISQGGDYNNPKWAQYKQEMLTTLKQGVDINRHYRKITPMAADELAKWGDWKDAIWVWESVLSSRPYVVAIITNMARGYAMTGDNARAHEYLERARKLQPTAAGVTSLEVILLGREGQQAQAIKLARTLLQQGRYDFDLVSTSYTLGVRAKDWALALQALDLIRKDWPSRADDANLRMASIYATVPEVQDEAKALEAYRRAWAVVPEARRAEMRAVIPPAYLSKL